MMKQSLFAAVFLSCLLLAGGATALERWDFGRLAYGSQVENAPSWAADYACDEEGACTFTDPRGVYYLTWDEEVVIKRFDVTERNYRQIPFGVDYSLSPQSIVQKVEQQTGKKLECVRHQDNKNIEPGTMFCHAVALDGDPGVLLQLTFDEDGKLKKIELWTHYI
jgi:hypothetical protein